MLEWDKPSGPLDASAIIILYVRRAREGQSIK